MQGLVTNLAPGLNTAEGPAPSATGQNSGVNGVSSAQPGFSPLFSNLLSAAAQPGGSLFESPLLNSFSAQGVPPEGQFLPPAAALGMMNRNGYELKESLADLPDELGGALPIDLNALLMVPNSGGVTVDRTLRSQPLAAQMAESGSVASQLNGQGQNRLQQEMFMRQMALSSSEGGGEELATLRLTPQIENSAMPANGAQLSAMLRDAMLLKQQATPGNSGGESFSTALNSLATLVTDGKATGESKPVTQASINTPFAQQANWGEEVGSRVKWMVNSQVQSAELKMNPAHLGPVEVKISVQNEQTSIVFTAQNGAVREALDSAIPRLREMLGDNGMNMVDVDVSDQSFAQQQQAAAQDGDSMSGDDCDGSEGEGGGVHDPLDVDSGEEETVMLSSRMVDFYA